MTDEQIRQQLIQNRYVDDKGMPLSYDASASPLYAKHPYAEFKIMPVYMMLVMDQKRLPRLLVECANSKMPIEVRRVRISPAAAVGRPRKPGRRRAPFGRHGRHRSGGAGMGGQTQESGQSDIPVEIHAVIYIFNPPDREKLGKGAAAAAAPPGGRAGARRFARRTACRSPAAAVGLPAAPANPRGNEP